MIQYIYFVKCHNCEDEHFDFFDEAKAFALGCLSQKPIITQIEVDRNDFGECTDSNDLGMIWSWEDECKECGPDVDQEKAGSHILTKADLENVPECDPEFDALDNSVEVEDDDFRAINDEELAEGIAGRLDSEADEIDLIELTNFCKEIGIETVADLDYFVKKESDRPGTLLDKLRSYRAELGPDFKLNEVYTDPETECIYNDYIECTNDGACDECSNNPNVDVELSRKPVPEGMTIEQLVEEMEENEDMVECTWCNDLFPKDQCRYEVDLGYLCSRCEAAIKSRGETLTFRENNYWDFLDEEVEETLAEHVNEEHPAIESEQKLDGIDNAVVDCKAAKVVTHSEDEKPVDCKGEKKPLEKPLTEENETSEVSPASKIRLAMCPECGAENAFDHETGICNNCGFNILGEDLTVQDTIKISSEIEKVAHPIKRDLAHLTSKVDELSRKVK